MLGFSLYCDYEHYHFLNFDINYAIAIALTITVAIVVNVTPKKQDLPRKDDSL